MSFFFEALIFFLKEYIFLKLSNLMHIFDLDVPYIFESYEHGPGMRTSGSLTYLFCSEATFNYSRRFGFPHKNLSP